MKYISFALILLWSLWCLYENIKPKDNYFLWILGAISITHSLINIIIFLIEGVNKIKSID